MNKTMKDNNTEKVAMNIVYQLGDILKASPEIRQATNDKAIDFTQDIISALLAQQKAELLAIIEEHRIEKEPLCEQNVLLTLISEKIKNL